MSSEHSDRLNRELNQFKEYKEYFLKRAEIDTSFKCSQIDTFGFILNAENEMGKPQIDLFIVGLTHGNEVIGIEIINKILAAIKHNNTKPKIGFLLNNTKAYLQGHRYLEYDLNRSFLSERKDTLEHLRADEIENIINNLNIKLLIDLHQCVEPTETSFSVIPEDDELIEISHKIAPEYAITTFSEAGFSNKGRTLVEYAKTLKIPALVYELGQKGFNKALSDEFSRILLGLNVDEILSNGNSKEIIYYHITGIIPNTQDFRLIPGLVSFQMLKVDEILAKNPDNLEYKCPRNSVLIFPRYINIDKTDAELAYLAERKISASLRLKKN